MSSRPLASSSGMVWMEILIALAVAGFIAVCGLRGVSLFMGQMGASRLWQVRQVELGQLHSSLQRAWDQRCSHIYQQEAWLEAVGPRKGDFIDLSLFRMRTHFTEGKPLYWDLREEAGRWILHEAGAGDSGEMASSRILSYRGKILVQLDPSSWEPGDIPGKISFKFPDAEDEQFKDGFAIHRLW